MTRGEELLLEIRKARSRYIQAFNHLGRLLAVEAKIQNEETTRQVFKSHGWDVSGHAQYRGFDPEWADEPMRLQGYSEKMIAAQKQTGTARRLRDKTKHVYVCLVTEYANDFGLRGL